MKHKALLKLACIKIAAQQPSPGDDGQVGIFDHLLAGAGAGMATDLGVGLVNNKYIDAVGGHKADGSMAHATANDYVRNILSNKGIGVSSNRPGSDFSANIDLNREPMKAGFDPMRNMVYAADNAHPGTLAHEAGHALGPGALTAANIGGKFGAGIAGLYSLFGTRDKDTADTASLAAGGIHALGTLPSEIDASRRGFNMLHGLPFKDKIHSYMGVPTYLLASIAPYLAVQLKNALGGYNSPKS